MTEYLVTWSMPIEAASPQDAAQQALDIHRDPASIATVFFAEDETGSRWRVDLHPDGTLSGPPVLTVDLDYEHESALRHEQHRVDVALADKEDEELHG